MQWLYGINLLLIMIGIGTNIWRIIMAMQPPPQPPQPQQQPAQSAPQITGPTTGSIVRRALTLTVAGIIALLRAYLLLPHNRGISIQLGYILELSLAAYGFGFVWWILGNIPEHRGRLAAALLQRWQQQQPPASSLSAAPGVYQGPVPQPTPLPVLTVWDFWMDIMGTATAGLAGALFLIDTLNRMFGIISDPLFNPLVTLGAFITMIATGIIVLIL